VNKILVIEDNLTIRSIILEILKEKNFQVIVAENGRIGVKFAQQLLPDLILCDVIMPEWDGYTVLSALQENSTTANIPFIFLTSLDDRVNIRKGMQLGADDYLPKPCSSEELIGAIAARLEKKSTFAKLYNTALQQVSQQLNRLPYYDSLTNLPNRLYLEEKFSEIVDRANLPQDITCDRVKSEPCLPILCFDLDRFNRIVKTLGHTSADLLTKAAVKRLQDCLERQDFIFRLSTKEFAIVPISIQQKQQTIKIARKILKAFSKPLVLEDGNEVLMTASIGIALYPYDGKEIGQLLLRANKAVDRARKRGGNLYEFFRTVLNFEFSNHLALESSLSYALERNQLQVHYQPRVNLNTGKIVGAEALLRWKHPEKGTISPSLFIPIAEETNLIIPIGEWLLKTVCQQAKRWQELGFAALQIAVNISGRQFNQPNLYPMLSQILIETGLHPRYLELELTESILVEQPDVSMLRLKVLKTLGLQIAIDDFGTGYSSLSYLQKFPVDILKIDRYFVQNLTKNQKTKAIATAIIQMARVLNLNLVAEGVENVAELDFLREHQCNEIQGYLFSCPLPAKDFEKLLLSGKKLGTEGK
jgi:diguanylate cyclase (GGDEF)-like protein